MATTTLFVEILVIGAVAECWLVLLIVAFIPPHDLAAVWCSLQQAGNLSTLLLVPFMALTYTAGWVVNFLAERLFKPFFQRHYRDKVFSEANTNYSAARVAVLQRGSVEVVTDLKFDRHIVRISRAGTVNFFFLAVALVPHITAGHSWLILPLVLFLASSVASFFQWWTRYRESYPKLLRAYTELAQTVNVPESICPVIMPSRSSRSRAAERGSR